MKYWKQTLLLRFFGLAKVPLIFLARPKIIYLDENRCEIRIPLNYLTRNHLKSMYFGTLAIGADVAGGLMAIEKIKKTGKKFSFLFKDFKADFLKRPEADTHFICNDGNKIEQMIHRALQTGERINEPLDIIATCPRKFGNEPVARFVLTLSLKLSKKD